MRNYERYDITEGTNAEFQETFATLQEALAYIAERYGADNIVEQLVQIDASGDDGEETFSCLDVYDMIKD
jgi:hypothetical protein